MTKKRAFMLFALRVFEDKYRNGYKEFCRILVGPLSPHSIEEHSVS